MSASQNTTALSTVSAATPSFSPESPAPIVSWFRLLPSQPNAITATRTTGNATESSVTVLVIAIRINLEQVVWQRIVGYIDMPIPGRPWTRYISTSRPILEGMLSMRPTGTVQNFLPLDWHWPEVGNRKTLISNETEPNFPYLEFYCISTGRQGRLDPEGRGVEVVEGFTVPYRPVDCFTTRNNW